MKYIPNKKYASIVLISILILCGLPFVFELGAEFSNVKAEADLDLECTETTKDVTPNFSGDKASVEYEITIWNRGLEEDSFILEAIKLNHAQWVRLSPSNSVSVNPDTSTLIKVTIEIDNKKLKTSETDPSNPHLLTNFTATSNRNSSKFESIILTTKILQAYRVQLTTPDDTIETPETFTGNYRVVTFELDIKNIGTGTDDFKLEISGENEDWGSLSRYYTDTLEIDNAETVTLTVKVPKEESPGENPLTVRAISRGDDTGFDDTKDEYNDVVCTVEVTQYYDVHIPSPTTIYTALPGETISYPDFIVKNRGNSQDDVRIETEGSEDLDWSPKTVEKILGKSGAADSSATVIITTTIPSDMRTGTYFINISLKSHTPTKYIYHINLTFIIKVKQVYKIDISTDDDSIGAKPGDTRSRKLKIWNRGNGKDTFNMSVMGAKSHWVDFKEGEDSITLNPDDSTFIDMIVTIPSLTEVKDREDIEPGSYEITVKAKSEGDDEIYDTLPITIKINKLYGIEFIHINTTTKEKPLIADSNKSDGVMYNFTIKNIGNTEDKITLGTNNAPKHWLISFNYQNFTLNSNETKEIIATIKFSNGIRASSGKYFFLTARSFDGSEYLDSVKVYLDVLQYDLKITYIETEEDITVGDTSTITATVKNVGTGTAEDIEIKFYDGNEYLGSVIVSEIGPGDVEKVEFEWDPTEGEHKLKVGAENPDNTQIIDETNTTVKPIKIEETISSMVISIIIIVAIFFLICVMVFFLVIKKKKKKSESGKTNKLPDPRIERHRSDVRSPQQSTSRQSKPGYGSQQAQYQALYGKSDRGQRNPPTKDDIID